MQARDQRNWLLENEVQLGNFLQSIREQYHLAETAQSTQRITYLDTFDWRIWRNGDVTRPRALVEQVCSRIKTRLYDIRDSNDKVIGRLSVVIEHQRLNNNRQGKALPMRLYAEPMRGYGKAFAAVLKVIEQSGIHGYGKDPLVQLLAMDERSPGEFQCDQVAGLLWNWGFRTRKPVPEEFH